MTFRDTESRRADDDVRTDLAALLAVGVTAWGIGIVRHRLDAARSRRGKNVDSEASENVPDTPTSNVSTRPIIDQ